MNRPSVKIAIGVVLVAVAAVGVGWWKGWILPTATSQRPKLAETPPLPPVARSSLIVIPVAIRLSAIQDAIERQMPRDLTGKPDVPPLPNVSDAKINWSLARDPFLVSGTRDGLRLSSSLRGSLVAIGQFTNPPDPPGDLKMPNTPPDDGDLPDMPKEAEKELREFLGPFAPPSKRSRTQQKDTRTPAVQNKDQTKEALDQRVEFSGQIALTARPNLHPDWRLEPNLAAQVTIGNAQLSLMGTTINLSDEMKPAVEAAINQQVTELQTQFGNSPMLQEAVRAEWAKMCRSVPLGAGPPGTPDLWLEFRPTRAMAAQPRIDANALTLTIGVRADTRIVTKETKPDCPFPAQLDIIAQMDQGRVNIDLPIDLPFEQVNRLIEEQMKGKTFPLDESGAFTATVTSIEVAPSGDRLLMALGIHAKETKTALGLGADATVYVWGRPTVDRKRQKLRFEDIALDVQSEAAFGAFGFAARAAVPYLQKTLAENAEIDLAPMVADARKNIEQAIAEFRKQGDDVQLDAQVDNVSLAGIQFDAKTLRIITSADGTVRVAINKLRDK